MTNLLFAALPWLLYAFVPGAGLPVTGVLLALAAAIFQTVRLANQTSVKSMEWTTLAFFLIATIATMFGGVAPLFWKYNLVVIWTLFAAVAWASILIGAPFTLPYARETTPPAFWETQLFFRTNQVIALYWGAAFGINLAIVSLSAKPIGRPPVAAVLVPMLLIFSAFGFTAWYSRAATRGLETANPGPASAVK